MKLEDIKPLYDAFKEYATVYTSRGADYSITDLIKSPRQVRLFKRHYEEIHRDVDILKSLGSFRGTAIHDLFKKLLWKIIQKSNDKDYMVESMVWDRLCGRRISGRIDVLWRDILFDFKTTSAWKKVFGDFGEWEQQLNMYAFMLALIRVPVTQIAVISWYQDWDKLKVYANKQYPKEPMELIPLKVWTPAEQQAHIVSRIELHKQWETTSDNDLPYCTSIEMWAKEDSWAAYKLTKDGSLSKKASRVLPSSKAIQKWIGAKPDFKVVHRPGGRTKCEDWCSVMPWCIQHKEYLEGI